MTRITEHISDLEFGNNNIAVAELRGRKICIARHQDEFYAFAYKCPHAGGILAHGWIDPLGHLVCPLHRYRYSMANGRNVSGEGYYLKHWKVIINEEGVWVED